MYYGVALVIGFVFLSYFTPLQPVGHSGSRPYVMSQCTQEYTASCLFVVRHLMSVLQYRNLSANCQRCKVSTLGTGDGTCSLPSMFNVTSISTPPYAN